MAKGNFERHNKATEGLFIKQTTADANTAIPIKEAQETSKLTVIISKERLKKLKRLALEQDTSMRQLIEDYIDSL